MHFMSLDHTSHEPYMARAIALAKKAQYTTHPNPRVGCVLVKNKMIIGEGWHKRAGQAHAEVNAIAAAREQGHDTAGATAYVTLEPCSHHGRTGPCCEVLVNAGIVKVVIGMKDTNAQVNGQGIAYLLDKCIEVIAPMLEAECRKLNVGFIKRMETGLPYVRVKLASSLDGKVAMANGESQWITDADAREDVQHFRALSDAVITGTGTVYADNPSLTVRPETWRYRQYSSNQVRQPLRVVLSIQPPQKDDLTLLTDGNQTQWLTPQTVNIYNLPEVLRTLAQQQINEVWVEAGATLAGAFIEQGCADELIIYQSPCLLGHNAQSMVKLSIKHLCDKQQLKYTDVRRVGDAIRITARLINDVS